MVGVRRSLPFADPTKFKLAEPASHVVAPSVSFYLCFAQWAQGKILSESIFFLELLFQVLFAGQSLVIIIFAAHADFGLADSALDPFYCLVFGNHCSFAVWFSTVSQLLVRILQSSDAPLL